MTMNYKYLTVIVGLCLIFTANTGERMTGEEHNNSITSQVFLFDIAVSDAYAQEIYKSVDGDGNIIYSEEPPTEPGNVEILESAPEPGTEEVEEAQRQIQELESSTNALEREGDQQTSNQQAGGGDAANGATGLGTVTRAVGAGVVYGGVPVARHYHNNPHVRHHRGGR
jgi:hypothetical protein